jgi:hypothetical protein
MIQPKIQEVYFPIEDINSDDFTPHILCHESGEYIQNLERQNLITFTPEEFEQFKREFGKNTLKELFDWCEYRQEKSANSSKAAWNMIIDKLKELL